MSEVCWCGHESGVHRSVMIDYLQRGPVIRSRLYECRAKWYEDNSPGTEFFCRCEQYAPAR